MPHWVYQNGTSLHVTVALHGGSGKCRDITVPVPWNAYFLEAYDGLINATAAHLATLPGGLAGLTQVKATGINEFTEETRTPYQVPAAGSTTCHLTNALTAWQKVGYRPALVESAWNNLVDTWGDGVPRRLGGQLDSRQLLPRPRRQRRVRSAKAGRELTGRLVADGTAWYGSRLAVQSNALTATGGTLSSVDEAHTRGATIGFQLAENQFGNPTCPGVVLAKGLAKNACDHVAIQRALALGISHGVSYLEVFPRTVAGFQLQFRCGPQLAGLTPPPLSLLDDRGAGAEVAGCTGFPVQVHAVRGDGRRSNDGGSSRRAAIVRVCSAHSQSVLVTIVGAVAVRTVGAGAVGAGAAGAPGGTVSSYPDPSIQGPKGISRRPGRRAWFTNTTTTRSGGSPPPGR